MIATVAFIFSLIRELVFYRRESRILKITQNFIAVDKAYDLKINSNEPKEITLQTFLKKKFPKLASDNLYHEFYFVHRLDFSTSGVMCIPLNKKACKAVALAFQDRFTQKYYIALVRGWFSVDYMDINTPIGEDKRNADVQKMCCDEQFYIKPKKSRSLMVVLERGIYKNYPSTKIVIRPMTGRRHQIRAHCNHLGHTIVGDFTYSNRRDIEPFRMYLHSLRLVVPTTIEHFDVQTEDPFLYDRHWCGLEVVNELNWDIFEKFNLSEDCVTTPIFN